MSEKSFETLPLSVRSVMSVRSTPAPKTRSATRSWAVKPPSVIMT